GDGGNGGGAASRDQSADQGDQRAHAHGDHNGSGHHREGAVGDADADQFHTLFDQFGHADPDPDTDSGGEHGEGGRFDQDHTGHLGRGGAHRPQQGQLPDPLGDGDPEGVLDHEGSHENGHTGEGQECGGEEAETLG